MKNFFSKAVEVFPGFLLSLTAQNLTIVKQVVDQSEIYLFLFSFKRNFWNFNYDKCDFNYSEYTVY